jgi:hypothetical protein
MSQYEKKPFIGLRAGKDGFFFTSRLSEYDLNQLKAIVAAMEKDLETVKSAGADQKAYIGALNGRPLKEETKAKFKRPEFAPDLILEYQTAAELATRKAAREKSLDF